MQPAQRATQRRARPPHLYRARVVAATALATLLVLAVRQLRVVQGTSGPLGGRIVAAQLLGGLGNQLFVAATAVAYAKRFGASLLLCMPDSGDPRANETSVFASTVFAALHTTTACGDDLPSLVAVSDGNINVSTLWQGGGNYQAFEELPPPPPRHRCLPRMWSALLRGGVPAVFCGSIVVLRGYFQHAAYFDDARDDVLAAFAPRPDIAATLIAKYPQVVGAVAVHVRRGDFVTMGARVLNATYYERGVAAVLAANGARPDGRATDHLRSKLPPQHPHVLVFSDDLPWVWKQPFFRNLRTRGLASAVGEPDALRALYLMSLAGRGLVCPNSSFCWWAAWLGNAAAAAATATAPHARPVVLPFPWSPWPGPSPPLADLGFYRVPGAIVLDA